MAEKISATPKQVAAEIVRFHYALATEPAMEPFTVNYLTRQYGEALIEQIGYIPEPVLAASAAPIEGGADCICALGCGVKLDYRPAQGSVPGAFVSLSGRDSFVSTLVSSETARGILAAALESEAKGV